MATKKKAVPPEGSACVTRDCSLIVSIEVKPPKLHAFAKDSAFFPGSGGKEFLLIF